MEQLSGPVRPRTGGSCLLKRGIIQCHYHARSAGTKQASRLTPEKKPLSRPLKGPEPSQGPLLPARAPEPNPENRSRVCSLQYHRNKGVSEGSSRSEVNPASTEVPEDPGLAKSPASASAGDRGRLRSPR